MSSATSQPIRVLCVDDNRDAAESLALVLELFGLTAAPAFDGAGALAVVDQSWINVCISDINMPGMDGYELARRLRAQAGGRPLLLIALSARTTDEDRRRSVTAGFDLHINKPGDPVELAAAILAFARQQGMDSDSFDGPARRQTA